MYRRVGAYLLRRGTGEAGVAGVTRAVIMASGHPGGLSGQCSLSSLDVCKTVALPDSVSAECRLERVEKKVEGMEWPSPR